MNLLNIYIVLAYYDKAYKSHKKGQGNKNKLTNQKFNVQFVNKQIQQIFSYKQSALHWNTNLFKENFARIFSQALDSYDQISEKTGVEIHSRKNLDGYIKEIEEEFKQFEKTSLEKSKQATERECNIIQPSEYLIDGTKGIFTIENYLGGFYYLTSDEVYENDGVYIIQESKNATKDPLPKISDIQDGLFKLILFSNLDKLEVEGRLVSFTTKFKLTGKGINGSLKLPLNSTKELDLFLINNKHIFKKSHLKIIDKLISETQKNTNLNIQISGNYYA